MREKRWKRKSGREGKRREGRGKKEYDMERRWKNCVC